MLKVVIAATTAVRNASTKCSKTFVRNSSSSSNSNAAAGTIKHTVSTDAGKLIQRRATTGSVSSVFYLKELVHQSSNPQQAIQQAKQIESIFQWTVGGPIVVLGLAGLYRMAFYNSAEDE